MLHKVHFFSVVEQRCLVVENTLLSEILNKTHRRMSVDRCTTTDAW